MSRLQIGTINTSLQDIITQDLRKTSSGDIGNDLRDACYLNNSKLKTEMDKIIDAFRTEMMKLMQAPDDAIYDRTVNISAPDKVFPNLKDCK